MTTYASMILNPWSASKIPSLAGKVAVVTGGGEGIGAAFVHALLKNSISKVFLVSNDPERYEQVKEQWKKDTGADPPTVFYQADLGDNQQVDQVVTKIRENTDRIDIVNLNAAIGMYATDVPQDTNVQSHAIDRHFACNNVGHAILLQGLLPVIKKTSKEHGEARIVIMASNLHFSAPSSVKFKSMEELHEDLGPTLQYNRSKLANVLYCKKLHRIFRAEGLQSIKINCCHPGVVKTAQQDGVVETYNDKIQDVLGHNAASRVAQSALSGLNQAARAIAMKDSPEGALSALYAATSPEVTEQDISGEYIVPNGHVQEADKRALDYEIQDDCWELIQECIKQGLGNAQGVDHQEGSLARGSATM
jgi:NAD(P)-dependent dehydrogenase (short-subunit alcohol dehydrogenase family)